MNYLIAITLLTAGILSADDIAVKENPHAKHIGLENGLRPKILITGDVKNRGNLLKRMQHFKVSAVSISVINKGKIELSKGYGHITANPDSLAVNMHTLFQAGSISKALTAFGALILVQQGKLSLDEDVNPYLKRWKIPENEFTDTEKVTLRRLLSHTAGVNVHGFPGYALKLPIPTIIDVLNGKKPEVNTDPIKIIHAPGTKLKYSGGGTTIVQLLIEDITGESFDVWMKNNVLNPLEMNESTFTQPLPLDFAVHAAYGHHLNNVIVEGKWHNYPEMAAAGLWTTSNDLAQFIVYIQTALRVEKTAPLSSTYVKQMVTRQKIGDKEINSGLGFFLENEDSDLMFSHSGQDEGFIARLSGYAYRGQGAVIMMNNDSGWPLMEEITNSIADVYMWPYFKPIEKKTIVLNASSLTPFPGRYESKEDEFEIILRDGNLYIDFKKGVGPFKLFPSGKNKFFVQEDKNEIEFLAFKERPERLIFTDAKGAKTIFKRKMKDDKPNEKSLSSII